MGLHIFKITRLFVTCSTPRYRIQKRISKNILIRLTNHYEDILKKKPFTILIFYILIIIIIIIIIVKFQKFLFNVFYSSVKVGALRYDIEDTVCYLDSFEYLMRGLMVQKMKEVRPPKQKEVADEGSQTLPQSAARSTPDTRKRPRESTASPEVPAAKKPRASNKEKEWVEVPNRKDLRKKKKKEKKPSRTPEKSRHACPEAVLIKPAEGMSYDSILRELKKHVNPDELGATVQGIRETRSKDLLVELTCSTKSRERLDTTFKEVVGADLEPTIGAEDVEDDVRSYFDQGPELELRVSLSKTPCRGNRKAYVLLEEARALKLLKGAHIKIGWVFCRVRRKKEVNRWFRCLGFGHIAADFRGQDHSRCLSGGSPE